MPNLPLLVAKATAMQKVMGHCRGPDDVARLVCSRHGHAPEGRVEGREDGARRVVGSCARCGLKT